MSRRSSLEAIWAEIHDFTKGPNNSDKNWEKPTLCFVDSPDHSFPRYHHLVGCPLLRGKRNAEDDNRHEYTKGVLPCRWLYGRNGVCRIERREIRPPFFTGQTGKFCRA